MKNVLKWKQKSCFDGSANWVEADVKPLNWTYVVDTDWDTKEFATFLFVNDFADDIRLSKRTFKTQEAAQKFCEEHLLSIYQKLSKLFA